MIYFIITKKHAHQKIWFGCPWTQNMCRKYVCILFTVFILLTKNKQYNECELLQKKITCHYIFFHMFWVHGHPNHIFWWACFFVIIKYITKILTIKSRHFLSPPGVLPGSRTPGLIGLRNLCHNPHLSALYAKRLYNTIYTAIVYICSILDSDFKSIFYKYFKQITEKEYGPK